MKKRMGLKLLAVSIALLIVVSGVTPCIAVSNPTSNAVSKEMTQYNGTIYAQHLMSFPFLSINGYDLMKDENTAISNKELAAKSTTPEEWYRTSYYTEFSGGIPPALPPSSLNKENASYLQLEKVPANSELLFLNTYVSTFNTDWDGYSDLADLLRNMGFTVEERDVNPITYNQIKDYDLIVITGSDKRVFPSSEVEAIVEYVENGGGLVLLG